MQPGQRDEFITLQFVIFIIPTSSEKKAANYRIPVTRYGPREVFQS